MTTPATILITGATDGIGRALAYHYAQHGFCGRPARLILIGRRTLAELDSSFFTPATYYQSDLSQHDCADQIAAWLAIQGIDRLDLLVHNAGLGYVGPIADQPVDNIQQLLTVNLYTPIALTHRLLPLVEAAHGIIAYISSIISALPAPNYAVYAASKAALDGFVRNFQIEVAAAASPVHIQLIHPGATRTGMHAKSGLDRTATKWERFPTAESVAVHIANAITKGKRTTTIGAVNRLLQWSGRHLAGPISWAMRQRAQRTETASKLPRQPAPQPHAVITGAADGIGKALAAAYAAAGFRITGIDVDTARADQTQAELANQGADITFFQANLVDANDVLRVGAELCSGPPITTLIHNAGINAVGHYAQMPLHPQLRVLDVNLTAPLLLTRRLLAHRHLCPGSTIVCISSLSHFVGYPGAAIYAASKDGLASYARSLAVALSPRNINVLTVFPGPTRTAHARQHSPDNSREEKRMRPEALAAYILQAATARRALLIPGFGNRLFAQLGHLAPRLTEQAMRRAILDKLSDL